MKKNYLNILLMSCFGLGLVACGAGSTTTQPMPPGTWSMTFTPGLTNTPCNGKGTIESDTVYIQSNTYATTGYQGIGLLTVLPVIFTGTFESQIGSNDTCMNANITNSGATLFQQCQNINGSTSTIVFYGCSVSSNGFNYFFNASYRLMTNGVTMLTGNVSGRQ